MPKAPPVNFVGSNFHVKIHSEQILIIKYYNLIWLELPLNDIEVFYVPVSKTWTLLMTEMPRWHKAGQTLSE